MGRTDVAVRVGAFHAVEREAPRAVYLAVGMPANERMDWLVEKAAELGVAGIQPLLAERSVLRVAGERAAKKQAHWQAIAIAACEQCGRNRVPVIAPVLELARWCADPGLPSLRLALSLAPDARPLARVVAQAPAEPVLLLSGPEGGLSPAELGMLASRGFLPASLGPRVLRADTAPLAALAALIL
jgi:16S rRNA (uracil1498-N3)-methyltransferase